MNLVAEEGLEQPQENTGNTGVSPEGGAKSGAPEALLDADLAGWLDDCPVPLDEDAKAGILAMMRASGVGDGQGR